MWVLVMVLVGYGSNDNRLRVWWVHQRLLPSIYQLSEPEHWEVSDYEPCYASLYFEEEEWD